MDYFERGNLKFEGGHGSWHVYEKEEDEFGRTAWVHIGVIYDDDENEDSLYQQARDRWFS